VSVSVHSIVNTVVFAIVSTATASPMHATPPLPVGESNVALNRHFVWSVFHTDSNAEAQYTPAYLSKRE
jgi:hypothetical protein